MIAALGGLAGKAISGIFGWLLSHPLILAGLLIVVAYNFGYWLGERDGTRDMVSKLEIASLEATIANLEREKKIAEDAAKQAASDEASAADLASKLAGELDAYKEKLAAAGRKCDLTPDDMCDIYGMSSPQCKNRDKKHRNKTTGLAARILGYEPAGIDGQRLCRPQAMRECG